MDGEANSMTRRELMRNAAVVARREALTERSETAPRRRRNVTAWEVVDDCRAQRGAAEGGARVAARTGLLSRPRLVAWRPRTH